MYHDKISFWHVEKEAENLIIYTHYDTETNFTLTTVIKQKDVQRVVKVLKNINHDSEDDINDDDSNENSAGIVFDKIQDSDYRIYISAEKFNYSFREKEFQICSFWNNKSIKSRSIEIPYKDYADLRNQLDSLIAEIEKVL